MPKVEKVYKRITHHPNVVEETATVTDILNVNKQTDPIHRCLYVVNSQKKLVGLITLQELLNLISIQSGLYNEPSSFSKVKLLKYINRNAVAKDIMLPAIYTTLNELIEDAIQKMIKHRLEELPVVDESLQIIGDLNAYELLLEF